MPELPEAETIRRQILPAVKGKQITVAHLHKSRVLRAPTNPSSLARALKGQCICDVQRRGKALILQLNNSLSLVIRLGMSGTLKVVPADYPFDRHTHMRLELAGGDELHFRDPRMFGLIALRNGLDINAFPEFVHYGPEPLSKEFSADYLANKLNNRTAKIGILLMDQRVVTGLGKIYADEVLFCAGIRPNRAAGRLTKKEIAKLIVCIKKVLEKAIGDRGTSASDGSYVDAYGLHGGFRPVAYQRTGQPCVKCHQPIRRTRLTGGRGLHWCAKCQK